MWNKGLPALLGAGLLADCSGAVHQLPSVDQGNLNLVQTELQKAGGAPQRHDVTNEDAGAILRSALARIRPEANRLCREMAIGVCEWRFSLVSNRSMNAGAGPNGVITVNRGVVEYANSEEELALVIAHEIGHQSANHVAAGRRNQVVGSI